jgi:hypothetical protein
MCKKDKTQVKQTFQNLNWLPNYCALDLTLLTCGNPTLPYEQNEIIFKHVFEYIKRSERFLIADNNANHMLLTSDLNSSIVLTGNIIFVSIYIPLFSI